MEIKVGNLSDAVGNGNMTAKKAIKIARKGWMDSASGVEKRWIASAFDEGVRLGRAEALGLKCIDGDPIKVVEKEG